MIFYKKLQIWSLSNSIYRVLLEKLVFKA